MFSNDHCQRALQLIPNKKMARDPDLQFRSGRDSLTSGRSSGKENFLAMRRKIRIARWVYACRKYINCTSMSS